MFTKMLTNLEMQGDTIVLTGRGFETTIDYKRISTLDICVETDSVIKKSATPPKCLNDIEFEKKEYLHIYLVVAGTAFHFDVSKEKGQTLALRAANETAELLDGVPISKRTEKFLEKLRSADIADISYPVHFHKLFEDHNDRHFPDESLEPLTGYVMMDVPVLGTIK
jgi:hypothetical protein